MIKSGKKFYRRGAEPQRRRDIVKNDSSKSSTAEKLEILYYRLFIVSV